MISVVFVGHVTIVGILEGNYVKQPLAIIGSEDGSMRLVPFVGQSPNDLKDIYINQPILSYELSNPDVKRAYIKATTGLILAS